MDAVKVENFLREKPSAEFPRFVHLGMVECDKLRTAIASRIGLGPDSEPLAILDTLVATAKLLPDVDAEQGFNFCDVISKLGLETREDLFVNWHSFDNIDKIAAIDLSEQFDDIWYPSSDDMEIFDAGLEWFILVRHDGCVSVLDLSAQGLDQ